MNNVALGLPSISIKFIQEGITAISRGSRGIVAMIIKENKAISPATIVDVTDIPADVSADNKRLIKKSGTEIYLLYHSKIPSVMVECGFMSNSNDMNDLKNQDYQRILAFSIADGITNYLKTQGWFYGTEK